MISAVILPTAVRLLKQQGMTVSKEVMQQLEDLQKAHRHYMKRPNNFKKKRSKSLGDRPTCEKLRHPMNLENLASSSGSQNTNDQIHSTRTTPDLELDDSSGQPRSIRSHTVQYVRSNTPMRVSNGSRRPLSAPGILGVDQVPENDAVRVPPRISEEDPNQRDTEKLPTYLEVPSESPVIGTSAESGQNNNKVTQVLSEEPDPDESITGDSECSLRKLHVKIHTSLESVTLVDVHKALVTTKNYSHRLEHFIRSIEVSGGV